MANELIWSVILANPTDPVLVPDYSQERTSPRTFFHAPMFLISYGGFQNLAARLMALAFLRRLLRSRVLYCLEVQVGNHRKSPHSRRLTELKDRIRKKDTLTGNGFRLQQRYSRWPAARQRNQQRRRRLRNGLASHTLSRSGSSARQNPMAAAVKGLQRSSMFFIFQNSFSLSRAFPHRDSKEHGGSTATAAGSSTAMTTLATTIAFSPCTLVRQRRRLKLRLRASRKVTVLPPTAMVKPWLGEAATQSCSGGTTFFLSLSRLSLFDTLTTQFLSLLHHDGGATTSLSSAGAVVLPLFLSSVRVGVFGIGVLGFGLCGVRND
ncbi:hypothetical protein PIB30_075966 [Stylosanthes scabra]|uniref:Uncharacterized protein n=1 Tax=Stylosanthes scabra TaxID=79078 RepID=A0ABU6VQ71_9FABA|nr:hypothetical protein [Stylosanthes scabra]